MEQQQQQNAQQLFPPPPPFYSLYSAGADGSAERPLPPLPPALPTAGEYTVFGVVHTVESGLPRLQGRQIYAAQPDGSIADIKGQLLVLHRELVANLVELLNLLVDKPSAYARQVENVMLLFRNCMHLCNLLRPNQARASLLATLQRDLAQRREAAQQLRQLGAAADAALQAAAGRLERAAAAVKAGGMAVKAEAEALGKGAAVAAAVKTEVKTEADEG
eukprot:scaffold14.g1113.t1